MAKLKLAVTTFCEKSIPTGDIDARQSLAQVAPELGVEIHQRIQRRRGTEFDHYQPELAVKHTFVEPTGLKVEVSGRIDGIWRDAGDDTLVIEEIKSTFQVKRLVSQLDADPEHPYLMQLKLYCWVRAKIDTSPLRAQLLLVAAGSREETLYPVKIDMAEIDLWLERKLAWITETWTKVEAFRAAQKLRGDGLKFPFPKKRPGQLALIGDVTAACETDRHLLAQAPTGLGKTAAVIIPSLKSALAHGEKLFHVTPKNSQLREAEKVIQKMQAKGSGVRAMIATAKAKICMLPEPECQASVCSFARGHYDRVNEHGLIAKLQETPLINQEVLQQFAHEYHVCPYELGRQLMPWMDFIAGDYHYALSPNATFQDTAALPLVTNPKPRLTIDEAHNLAERGIDWYSSAVEPIPQELVSASGRALQKVLKEVNAWIAQPGGSSSGAAVQKRMHVLRQFDRQGLSEAVGRWSALMPQVLEGLTESAESEPLVMRWFSWIQFAQLAELPPELFFATIDVSSGRVALHCANAGPLMQDKLADFPTVVAFSATLKPFDFHIKMCGFSPERTDTKEYESPFPPENRRIIAIPQVSTAWKDRGQSITRIADVINRITALRKGNYIAFFPSFELMRQTLPHIQVKDLEVFDQPPGASQHWTRMMLKTLKRRRNVLLLAVQGGVLSEGVDLPGDSLIGAFVIGPALPMVTDEREERRRILHQLYGDGFALAYINPAMARSVQSAGRVVRTPKDRGLVILIDPRFLTPAYAQAFPKDWVREGETPQSLKSSAILADVEKFWTETH